MKNGTQVCSKKSGPSRSPLFVARRQRPLAVDLLVAKRGPGGWSFVKTRSRRRRLAEGQSLQGDHQPATASANRRATFGSVSQREGCPRETSPEGAPRSPSRPVSPPSVHDQARVEGKGRAARRCDGYGAVMGVYRPAPIDLRESRRRRDGRMPR